MVQAPAYAPGTPIWVDLGSPDLDASKAFYGEVFGWNADTQTAPEAGGYTFFRRDGKVVAGLGPLQGTGMPPVWSSYISTDDADATANLVVEAGGTVVVPPFDVMGEGRMAVFQDPGGAFISVWQPQRMGGAELFNAPGSLNWNELSARDIEAVKPFYERVFGWQAHTSSIDPSGPYTEFKLNGRSVAGAMPMGPQVPAEVPPHWMAYFAVADCDASVETINHAGGQVMVGPMNVSVGRFAIAADPHGAPFAVIQLQS